MRYLLFVLTLLAGISSAIAPASAEGSWGDNSQGRHCHSQGGNDSPQGNEDCE
jgi:hypothetical protein